LESLPYLWKFLKEKNLLKNFPISEKTTKWWDKLTKSISNEQKIITYTNFLPNKLQFKTKLYIYPGFEYKIINQLITNFHLPKSSLLMLVAAFMGYENMKKAYQHAIKNNYKFFSFGDATRIIK
jgi:S-adenosylmethionine:tRNA-ribosyltransferase-isomerase (queuine synthetase)